ncbi:HD-GYP domain-containing protein [Geobacter sp. DSM 9736]|uniref:HD-GYP domain-containing protein n=1 Tax=Geobacter sp. DSM 9736 TaxID=1277350 RepID=UPI000B510135|nr:HD domain-containing phosphohydrolase [Geobacter sp. DSM 9736]SNB46022.1 HD domain-containing protein [Geobacter sp. DSM 9736]
MKDRDFRALAIESIIPEFFPQVALYIRNKNLGNYILYRKHDMSLTDNDLAKLRRSRLEFLYVRVIDIYIIADYLENNLPALVARDDIGSSAKGTMIYQASAYYLTDIFETPDKVMDHGRCRNVVRHLLGYLTSDQDPLKPLKTIMPQNFYIFVHSVQVSALMMLLHEKLLNLEEEALVEVGVGSLLHDVGMVFISDEILEKPEALSNIEYSLVKEHPEKGHEFMSGVEGISETALAIIRQHHERFNGSGYPDCLRGDSIHPSAQLAAICDTYFALTTSRPFRRGTSHEEALAMMRNLSAVFNPMLFEGFVEMISKHV